MRQRKWLSHSWEGHFFMPRCTGCGRFALCPHSTCRKTAAMCKSARSCAAGQQPSMYRIPADFEYPKSRTGEMWSCSINLPIFCTRDPCACLASCPEMPIVRKFLTNFVNALLGQAPHDGDVRKLARPCVLVPPALQLLRTALRSSTLVKGPGRICI